MPPEDNPADEREPTRGEWEAVENDRIECLKTEAAALVDSPEAFRVEYLIDIIERRTADRDRLLAAAKEAVGYCDAWVRETGQSGPYMARVVLQRALNGR